MPVTVEFESAGRYFRAECNNRTLRRFKQAADQGRRLQVGPDDIVVTLIDDGATLSRSAMLRASAEGLVALLNVPSEPIA